MTLPPKGLLHGSSQDSQGPSEKGNGVRLHVPKDLGDLAHLLFEWPIRQAPRLALPGCILIAAIIQAGMIVLFSISYTTPSDMAPQSPQIYFLPPDSAAARQLAPWLEANDPAVFSPQYATLSALPAPPPLKYRPSYEEPPPPLRPVPAEPPHTVKPPSLPLIETMRQQLHGDSKTVECTPQTQPPPTLPKTMVRWQDALASRTLLTTPAGMPLPAGVTTSLQPALYEVGVSAAGIPMHCVLLDTSGDSASDEAGSIWIHAQRFQSADQESWGRVLIIWGAPVGADIRKVPANPSVSPGALP